MSYSWGDDTSSSSDGGGYSYSQARSSYDDNSRTYASAKVSKSSGASRSYTPSRASSSSKSTTGTSGKSNIPDAVSKNLKTNTSYPLVVAVDVTGSMSEWPKIVFEKLPLLHKEADRYFPGTEISFCAVGDGHSDSYPLQVCEFGKGPTLDDYIKSLYPEGNGGGQSCESYDLAAYFYLKHCEIPKAKKPILIFTGDEGIYQLMNKDLVKKYIGDDLSEKVSAKEIFGQLCQKFDTYIIRKEYTCGYGSEEDKIHKQWQEYLGSKEKVIKLDDPRRIVDCMIGIIAGAAGNFDDYTQRLSQRQTPGQVSQVMNSLKYVSQKADANKQLANNAVSLKKLPYVSTSKKSNGLV